VRLVYTQISPGHIWTTLYLLFRMRVQPVFRSKQRTECLAFENGLNKESWFYSRQGRNFSLLQSVRIGSGFHPASESVAIGVKRPAREDGHSPSSIETENGLLYHHFPIRLHGVHRGIFENEVTVKWGNCIERNIIICSLFQSLLRWLH